MGKPRTIKKYSNRRLYDTENSCYITLADVRDMVLNYEDVIVLDSENGDDITRQILLQIVAEQELAGQPMFTKELLFHIIRFSGGAFSGVFTDYLEKAIHMVANQQQVYQRQITDMMSANLIAEMGEMAVKNVQTMTEMQQEFMKNYGFGAPKDNK